jgi:hypothetical protein
LQLGGTLPAPLFLFLAGILKQAKAEYVKLQGKELELPGWRFG